MGCHRLYPDMGAKPFVEYKDDDQYLYQVFNLGLSDIVVSDWKIATTSITSYQDYTWYPGDSKGRVLGFPGNVDSQQGGDLTKEIGWVTKTTSRDAYMIGYDLDAVLYYANNNGGIGQPFVSLQSRAQMISSSQNQSSSNNKTLNN